MPDSFANGIGSIFIPSSMTIVLYEGAFFNGRSLVLDSSIDCITDQRLKWSNATNRTAAGAGSMKVYAGGIDFPDEHIGCWAVADPLDVPYLLGNLSDTMTPAQCRSLALNQGYFFYGLANGTLCYASLFGPAPATKSGVCQLPCPGALLCISF